MKASFESLAVAAPVRATRAMGGCESCASGRRKEVQRLIDDAKPFTQRSFALNAMILFSLSVLIITSIPIIRRLMIDSDRDTDLLWLVLCL